MKAFKTPFFFLLLMMSLVADSNSGVEWNEISATANRIEITQAPLAWADFIHRMKHANVPDQAQEIAQLEKLMKQFEPQNSCHKQAVKILEQGVQAQKLFHGLQQQWHKSDEAFSGRLHEMKNADKWYQWLTLVWLGQDISPDELYSVGEASFKTAIDKYRQSANNQTQPKQQTLAANDDRGIQKTFQQIERAVEKNFEALFLNSSGFKQLKVARSIQGKDFPAPGYYDPSNQTMYYHPQDERYDLAQIPWLYLHEGMPGHHYQSMMSNNTIDCAELKLNPDWLANGRMAMVEGWAAYVETLGKDLGVLNDPLQHQFVLKWEALRAMRTMIDVGIHSKGWSVAYSKKFWQQHFPEGVDVMLREINRMKRWPMQVNTYVFGKHKIEQLKTKLKKQQGHAFDIRQFHHQLLKLSGMSVLALNDYQTIYTQSETIQ
ncbi:DUF885 family protein [Marinicella rhabdoformis]|uniref:DUF885 family protein n=1 Tax=Marinicella rhabdoformis TaxID=2580566 RepID=UPI0012AEB757|nr:DUF885 family protein [Marinicella rhabdoformis]